jgi:hypothetical protein
MRCRSLWVAALAAAVALSLSLYADEKKPDKAAANYVHVVVFHAKKDAPKDAVSAAIADCHELLAGIPSVRGLKVGRPAEMGDPNVPKQKYDFALLVLVDDYAGLKAYLDHPQHKKFVEKHVKNFDLEKLQVFDFTNEKK